MSKSFLIYMIGTSGSGKTTIANALTKELEKGGMCNLQMIDGDVIRSQFGGIFGYTYEERMKCNQAVRVVVHYLLNNGISVILSQVAAYEEMRKKVREQFEKEYIEVYIKCSYEECARRDVKGYYKMQKNGEMRGLNGADDIFEAPQNCDIVIDTEVKTVSEAVCDIVSFLKRSGYGI
ncbi:adenylyl-sulfate kinase [bacterium C-53]|nr:adenylyl-sulfate kinase [Lachnospiraceae bacterium]NBI02584.1 adenylyl-sulfate kinase [Lachnospiraceae bacterium]RKJ11226.1 adenylyl-sulfate kinase [bacterium C-53]